MKNEERNEKNYGCISIIIFVIIFGFCAYILEGFLQVVDKTVAVVDYYMIPIILAIGVIIFIVRRFITREEE